VYLGKLSVKYVCCFVHIYSYITDISLPATLKFSCVCGTLLHMVHIIDLELIDIFLVYLYKYQSAGIVM
jgi:hypothetical protein